MDMYFFAQAQTCQYCVKKIVDMRIENLASKNH